jgi:phage regulator Rha-like protein
MTALSSDLLTPIVEAYEGTPTTTSQDVADYFGKQHLNVLRDIRSLLKALGTELESKIGSRPAEQELKIESQLGSWNADSDTAALGPDLKIEQLLTPANPNFFLSYIDVAGPNNSIRKQPVYRMTRDGFVLLAMGFTGREALKFKLAYIEAFNRMEEALRQRPGGPTLEEALRDGRYIIRFEGHGQFSMQPVGKYVTCLNIDDERQMVDLISNVVPRSLVPAMLRAGIERLSQGGTKKLGGGR